MNASRDVKLNKCSEVSSHAPSLKHKAKHKYITQKQNFELLHKTNKQSFPVIYQLRVLVSVHESLAFRETDRKKNNERKKAKKGGESFTDFFFFSSGCWVVSCQLWRRVYLICFLFERHRGADFTPEPCVLTDTHTLERVCCDKAGWTVLCVCHCVQGILSDDCVLAAALWRNLFNRECEDPRQLELMVEYVRKQVSGSVYVWSFSFGKNSDSCCFALTALSFFLCLSVRVEVVERVFSKGVFR